MGGGLDDPQGVEGGRGGALYIGHRFADDRCLWSEHPYRGAAHKSDKSDESDKSDKSDVLPKYTKL